MCMSTNTYTPSSYELSGKVGGIQEMTKNDQRSNWVDKISKDLQMVKDVYLAESKVT